MSRRKYSFIKWTVVLFLIFVCNHVNCRPQETATASVISTIQVENQTTQNDNRVSSSKPEPTTTSTPSASDSRNVKNKGHIRDSIQMVASQLLENKNTTVETAVIDTRIPPKIKTQVNKSKVKTRNEDAINKIENSHTGVAVPVTMEELENEQNISEILGESSTSNEGISTWVLVSNPATKEKISTSTEPFKAEDVTKKPKPINKNKTKRPQINANKPAKRPIIAGLNKSDLIAGGSAINDNVLSKIKDTVLTNVQKNKASQKTTTQKVTTLLTTTEAPIIEVQTTKKESSTKSTGIVPVVKVTSKTTKKKIKNKQKLSTTEAPIASDSALLPMEPKEQEIELEINTPATTTKKPKRTSTKRKKTKTKKRKTTKPKQEVASKVTEVKTTNKTKSTKPAKKPDNPITSQIYNYLSREVMPSVGVGVIGLAGLVGLASYFLYPFASPVRRTFEVDKKDDIYRHNAEEYANEGNGQAEEEMLGTVLAGMPAHAKNKLNPYAGQMAYANRYNQKKEQDLRYRQAATLNYDSPNYNNIRYPQQKTGIAHGAVYTQAAAYNSQQYENRNAYTTEGKYAFEKSDYVPYQPVEPIYAAPQTGPSGASGYANDATNTVVYGVKPSADVDFKPVYPFEGQVFSETTSNPQNFGSTSMYLGSNNESQQQEDLKYEVEEDDINGSGVDNKFVVGNVPKELVDTATPAVVPEHGPRNLRRRKRATILRKRSSYIGTIDEILREANEKHKDIFLSNEVEERHSLGDQSINVEVMPELDIVTLPPKINTNKMKENSKNTIYSVDAIKYEDPMTTLVDKIIESVSTVPLNSKNDQNITGSQTTDTEVTTYAFRVYEVFSTSSDDVSNTNSHSSPLIKEESSKTPELTTAGLRANTETTTEPRSETTSNILPSVSPVFENSSPTDSAPTSTNPTNFPEVITYPPINGEGSFLTFLRRLIEFKIKLGMSILQTTSESLNRYLRSIANGNQN